MDHVTLRSYNNNNNSINNNKLEIYLLLYINYKCQAECLT